jgi:RHS repeat-associated protein
VGLTYFGKRYLNTQLQRWVSADPLEVSDAGATGEPNLYAYVSGQALSNIDPIGLCDNPGVDCSPSDASRASESDQGVDSVNYTDYDIDGQPNQSKAPTSAQAEKKQAPPPKRAEPKAAEATAKRALEYGLRIGFWKSNYDQAQQNAPENYDDYAALSEQKTKELEAECGESCKKYSAIVASAAGTVFVGVVAASGYAQGKGGGGGNRGPVTSRAARRQAAFNAGIPRSQQPLSQSRNQSGREYGYEVKGPGGTTVKMSVQQQTKDRSHPGEKHWEAGEVKTDPITGDIRMNRYGRPALKNSKSKEDYDVE